MPSNIAGKTTFEDTGDGFYIFEPQPTPQWIDKFKEVFAEKQKEAANKGEQIGDATFSSGGWLLRVKGVLRNSNVTKWSERVITETVKEVNDAV